MCIDLVKNGQSYQAWKLINEMPSTYQKNSSIKNIYIALTQSENLNEAQVLIDTMSEGADTKELAHEMPGVQSQ